MMVIDGNRQQLWKKKIPSEHFIKELGCFYSSKLHKATLDRPLHGFFKGIDYLAKISRLGWKEHLHISKMRVISGKIAKIVLRNFADVLMLRGEGRAGELPVIYKRACKTSDFAKLQLCDFKRYDSHTWLFINF